MKKLFAVVAALVAVAPFAAAQDKKAEKTIAEIVAGSKDHTVLLKAVKAAGLADTLGGTDEYTVFAPTDAAFKKIDKETLDAVLADKAKLKSILLAHVVKGTVLAADVIKMDGQDAETVQGSKFKVKVDGKKVMIGDATVTKADIKAKNGVVHVIDTVLMPTSK